MFGENTEQGRKKFVEDLEDTHVLFKEFITQHRPSVDIEKVATGEIWFGLRALDVSLIDALQTSDDYLFSQRKDADLYNVHIVVKRTLMEKLGVTIESSVENVFQKAYKQLSQRYFV
jgi:serine protease SohB